MQTVLADVWFSVRQLLKRPGFTTLAITAMAIGTGGVTAMFSVVDTVLLRPLPFTDSERLVSLCETHSSIEQFCVVSPPNAADWGRRSQTMASIGQGRSWAFTMRAGPGAESTQGGLATPSLFATLDLRPAAGRLFAHDEVGPGAHVALLAHAFWLSRFAGDAGIIGRSIDLDGVPHQVIGVLAPNGIVPGLEMVRVWTPLPFNPRDEERRRWRGFVTIGRLKPGITVDTATTELNSIQQALGRDFPQTNAGWGARVIPLLETVTGSIRPMLLALLGAVILLLLIACANVASLLVARGLARERELAVRASIGASRGVLVRLLAIESALVAVAGGTAGIVAATWVADGLLGLMPGGLPRIEHIALDGRVFAAAVGLTLGAGVVSGIAPALRASRVDVVDSLKEGLQPAAWRSALGLRRALLVVEVALAVVLAVGAGLLGRGFIKFLDWKPGFERQGLVTFWTFASQGTYASAASVAALFERIERELGTLPGVSAAGMASNGPLFGGTESGEFSLADEVTDEPITANWFDISPTYFPTLGLPVIRGRAFDTADRAGASPVAIVNQAFAARYLRGRESIGQRIRFGRREMEIVGVVADVPSFTPGAATRPEVYWPYQQSPRWASFVVVRTTLPADALRKTIEARLHTIDRDLAVSSYATMAERIDRQLARPRFQMLLVGAFAVMALGLTVIGIYGMMTMLVAGRQRELGVRVALGASRARLVAMVLGQALAVTVAGVTVGGLLALAASRLVRSLVPGVAPTDPATYAAVVLLVVVAATVAALMPAVTAARADPLRSLRAE
jgi:putative ABC transport system permease protein